MDWFSKRKASIYVLVLLVSLPAWGQDFGGSDFGNSGEFGGGLTSRNRSSRSSRSSGSSNNSGNSNDRYGNSSSDRYGNSRSDRNDSSRSRNSRDRYRSSQSGSRNGKTPTPAPGQPGQNGKQAVSVKGKTPAPQKSTGGGSSSGGGSARGATTVEFKMQANPSTNIVFIETVGQAPTMNINTVQGSKFVTRVAFRNPRHSRFDKVQVTLKYDTELLRPLGVDDASIVNMLAEPAQARVNARKGIISYSAKFSEPRASEELTLFKLEWLARAPAEHTAIAFLNTAEMPSQVLSGENNVLQPADQEQELEYSDQAGLLNADVAIAPDAKTARKMEDNDEITGIQLAQNVNQGTAEGGVELALRSKKATAALGEEFLVDVVYRNPKRSEIDLVKLKIRFDPRVLQVVDDDEGNWITRGINIYDGDSHEDLPFDYHIQNVAYNTTGEVYYSMGFSDRVRIPSSGVIATLRFRTVSSAPSTEVAFDLSEDDKLTCTAISFFGFNLIGKPGNRAASITNASMNID